MNRCDADEVGHRHDVVGTVGEAERTARPNPVAVTAVVERQDAKPLAEGLVTAEEVDVGRHAESVEQHDRRGARRSRKLAQDRRPAGSVIGRMIGSK